MIELKQSPVVFDELAHRYWLGDKELKGSGEESRRERPCRPCLHPALRGRRSLLRHPRNGGIRRHQGEGRTDAHSIGVHRQRRGTLRQCHRPRDDRPHGRHRACRYQDHLQAQLREDRPATVRLSEILRGSEPRLEGGEDSHALAERRAERVQGTAPLGGGSPRRHLPGDQRRSALRHHHHLRRPAHGLRRSGGRGGTSPPPTATCPRSSPKWRKRWRGWRCR